MIGKKTLHKGTAVCACVDFRNLSEEELEELKGNLGLSDEKIELNKKLSNKDFARLKRLITGDNITVVRLNDTRKLTLQDEDFTKSFDNAELMELNIETDGLENFRFQTERFSPRFGHYINKEEWIAKYGEEALKSSFLIIDYFYTDTKQWFFSLKECLYDILDIYINFRDPNIHYNIHQNEGWGFNAAYCTDRHFLYERGKGLTMRFRKEGLVTNYQIRSERRPHRGYIFVERDEIKRALQPAKRYFFITDKPVDYVLTGIEVDGVPRKSAERFSVQQVICRKDEGNRLEPKRIEAVGQTFELYPTQIGEQGVKYSAHLNAETGYIKIEIFNSETGEKFFQWTEGRWDGYFRSDQHPRLFNWKLYTAEYVALQNQNVRFEATRALEIINKILKELEPRKDNWDVSEREIERLKTLKESLERIKENPATATADIEKAGKRYSITSCVCAEYHHEGVKVSDTFVEEEYKQIFIQQAEEQKGFTPVFASLEEGYAYEIPLINEGAISVVCAHCNPPRPNAYLEVREEHEEEPEN